MIEDLSCGSISSLYQSSLHNRPSYVDKPNIVGRSAGIKCSFNNDGNYKVILIIWEEGLDFDEDDGGASLASGHGATTIVDIWEGWQKLWYQFLKWVLVVQIIIREVKNTRKIIRIWILVSKDDEDYIFFKLKRTWILECKLRWMD